MPTRTHSSDPFAPRGSLTREQLLAYAEGRLSPTEQHEVELHLEHDPLLREAMDGMRMPGARAALSALDSHRPGGAATSAKWWIAGGSMAAVVGAILWWNSSSPATEPMAERVPEQERAAVITEDPDHWIVPLENAEIVAAQEQPAELRIGHEPSALHTSAVSLAAERERGIDRVDPRKPQLNPVTSTPDVKPLRTTKTSRQLLFLHDLKVVHPQELYASDPQMLLADTHVAARYHDNRSQDSLRKENITLAYTRFMDDALGRFVNNDHKGCLDDLRFLLDQYPDDVNALFYGGLCAYNLGLYDRAGKLLQRAATHSVDVFDEEAAWYHALTLERLGQTEAAKEEFARIASQDGFYAKQAASRTAER